MEKTDHELLREYCFKRCEDSFHKLMERHLGLVFATARRVAGSAPAAEEIAQNVFIALSEKAVWLLGHASLAGWLHRTAINQARHYVRSEVRRRERELTAAIHHLADPAPGKASESMLPLLDKALLDLPAKEREALLLRFIQALPLREVGHQLGISEDAAQKRVSRALKSLSRSFTARGAEASSASAILAILAGAADISPPTLAGMAARSIRKPALPASGPMLALLRLGYFANTHTAALVVLLFSAPLAWETAQALKLARGEEKVSQQLSEARSEADQLRRQLDSGPRPVTAPRRSVVPPPHFGETLATLRGSNESGEFLWSDDKEHVRVPKSILSRVQFRELSDSSTLGGYRSGEAVVNEEGQPSPALLTAIGLSDAHQQTVGALFSSWVTNYQVMRDSQSYLTNLTMLKEAPPDIFPLNETTRAWVTPAMAENGALWREGLRAALASEIGEARAGLLLDQAHEALQRHLEEFGALEKIVGVTVLPTGRVKTIVLRRGPSLTNTMHHATWTAGGLDLLTHHGIPPALNRHLHAAGINTGVNP